jgi:hypothetical protein
MSLPHTNIGKLWNNDKEIFTAGGHDYEYDRPSEQLWSKLSNMYIDNPYQAQENINDRQVDMDEDDEECNIGWDAEEIVDECINKKPVTMSPKKCMAGYDRHFRSSTTKSGSSSLGQYKQSEGPTRHGFSTEDDEDNFLTLECDENLYDERPNKRKNEEEKVVINSKITKHFPVDKNIKRHQSKERRIISNPVNDTIPDFGFINSKETIVKEVENPKKQKEPSKKKIVINRNIKNKNQKKLKVKKNNENQNPFPKLDDQDIRKEHWLMEDVEVYESEEQEEIMNWQIESPEEPEYIPDCILSDNSNKDSPNQTFVFNHLDWTDNLEDDGMTGQLNSFIPESYGGYMDFNAEYEQFSTDMNQKKEEIEHKQKDVEAANINYLISAESAYIPDSNYFDHFQNDVTPIMRAILVDWMMEVCNEFTLKRETFYYAANYVDRYLSVHRNVKKEELQLVGVSAMFIASKMEEVYSPRVADFAKSTDNGYDVKQIVKMEKQILRELGWKTTPPTYSMWANWHMSQWDIYISTNEYALTHPTVQNNPDLMFKSWNEGAYARFREVMQILDIMIIDYTWLQYRPRALVAATMFLILGIHAREFDAELIWNEFIYTANRYLDGNSEYSLLFMDFLYLSFGFQLDELVPTIQFVSTFMSIPFNYDLPMYAQQQNALEGHFEEFLSYQTHHPLGLEFVKQKIASSNAF